MFEWKDIYNVFTYWKLQGHFRIVVKKKCNKTHTFSTNLNTKKNNTHFNTLFVKVCFHDKMVCL